MNIDPSDIIYFEYGFIKITATLVFTWITMIVLILSAFFLTRNMKSKGTISKKENIEGSLVTLLNEQIFQVTQSRNTNLLPFVGTLFIFIMGSVVLSIVPGFIAPTGSLNTTIALALCVFFAVPVYGIASQGIKNYLKEYIKPTFIMLPFNIISEFSRAVSLAVRLYGNVMSSTIIVAILITIVPLVFPVLLQLLGLLTGAIQAYIFAILSMVYISAATKDKDEVQQHTDS